MSRQCLGFTRFRPGRADPVDASRGNTALRGGCARRARVGRSPTLVQSPPGWLLDVEKHVDSSNFPERQPQFFERALCDLGRLVLVWPGRGTACEAVLPVTRQSPLDACPQNNGVSVDFQNRGGNDSNRIGIHGFNHNPRPLGHHVGLIAPERIRWRTWRYQRTRSLNQVLCRILPIGHHRSRGTTGANQDDCQPENVSVRPNHGATRKREGWKREGRSRSAAMAGKRAGSRAGRDGGRTTNREIRQDELQLPVSHGGPYDTPPP